MEPGYISIFFSRIILISLSWHRLSRARFLDLRYKEEDLSFRDEKLEKEGYYYSLDKYKSGGVIVEDKLS